MKKIADSKNICCFCFFVFMILCGFQAIINQQKKMLKSICPHRASLIQSFSA